MSWFDMLMMVAAQGSGELLKEEDWRNAANWKAKYGESSNRSNFILNDFISFKVGKTYTITLRYVQEDDPEILLPPNLRLYYRTLSEDRWGYVGYDTFTNSQTSDIVNKSITFTVQEGYYYVLWTNQTGTNLTNNFLPRIKSIIVTED